MNAIRESGGVQSRSGLFKNQLEGDQSLLLYFSSDNSLATNYLAIAPVQGFGNNGLNMKHIRGQGHTQFGILLTSEKLYKMGILDCAVWLITVGSMCRDCFLQRLTCEAVAAQKMLSNKTYDMLLNVGVSTGPLMNGWGNSVVLEEPISSNSDSLATIGLTSSKASYTLGNTVYLKATCQSPR
jgi:hypothetical protein